MNINLIELWPRLLSYKKLLLNMIELNDPYNAHHNNNSAGIAVSLAKRLGLNATKCEIINLAANLHDVGKQGIPKVILSKPSRLSKEEYQLVQTHVTIGADLLASADFPAEIVRAVVEHHERVDGSGYPNGLSGDEISIEGQVVGITDVISSLMSKRTYRVPLTKRQVVEILNDEAPKFDEVVLHKAMEIVCDTEMEKCLPDSRAEAYSAVQTHMQDMKS